MVADGRLGQLEGVVKMKKTGLPTLMGRHQGHQPQAHRIR